VGSLHLVGRETLHRILLLLVVCVLCIVFVMEAKWKGCGKAKRVLVGCE
jgi:hypothetical protein